MARAYLSLGSNLGDRHHYLLEAVAALSRKVGTVDALSSLYETEPWGFESPHPFLNAAVMLDTSLSPQELLLVTQQIECDLGRTHKSVDGRYADRTIDIDLLLVDDLVLDTPELILPHPHLHERRFVLEPLCEIAPDVVHPLRGKTMAALLSEI